MKLYIERREERANGCYRLKLTTIQTIKKGAKENDATESAVVESLVAEVAKLKAK